MPVFLHSVCLLLAVSGISFTADAWAVAPSDAHFIGQEPQRVYPVDAQTQLQHLKSGPWQEFIATDGQGWKARFDQVTGTPRRMWGKGIDVGNVDSASSVTAATMGLLQKHRALIGVPADQLILTTANFVEEVDTWYLEWIQELDGVPIYRSGVSARIKHGKLISVGVQNQSLPRSGHPSGDGTGTCTERSPHRLFSPAHVASARKHSRHHPTTPDLDGSKPDRFSPGKVGHLCGCHFRKTA